MQVSKLRPSTFISAGKHFRRATVTTTTFSETFDVIDNVTLKSWRNIPGPTSLPLIGASHHYLPGGMFYKLNDLELVTKAFNTYGPIVRVDNMIGLPHTIYLKDPESVSQVLRNENHRPLRMAIPSRGYYKKNLNKALKKGRPVGLNAEKGELWRELRSAASPVMLQPKTIRNYSSVLDKVAMEMVERIKSQRDEKSMIKSQFDKEMNLWALESIGLVALGCRLGCLDSTLNEDSPQRRIISANRKVFELGHKLDITPNIWHLITTPNFTKAMELNETHETLSKYFINLAMEELKTKNKPDDEKGVLEKLLSSHEEFAQIVTTDMLFASVHTVTIAIVSTLYLLAVNPDKQAKLREELKSNQENRPYLKACLKEALRIMPVLSSTNRITTRDYNLLGYKIPPGIKVIFAHHYMALMEEYFPQANEFIPERWLVENDDPLHYKHAHPFAYSAFGFGVRSCAGRRIAEVELEIFTARLVENFQVEWFGPPPRVQTYVINYQKGPFNFIFKDAPK